MIVIKVGGGAGVDLDTVCSDVAALVQSGQQVVLVHGTSDAANELAERMGIPARTIQSPSGYVSRYTDPETLEVYTMAAAGKVNKHIGTKLQALGVNAVGLSGVDGIRRRRAIDLPANVRRWRDAVLGRSAPGIDDAVRDDRARAEPDDDAA